MKVTHYAKLRTSRDVYFHISQPTVDRKLVRFFAPLVLLLTTSYLRAEHAALPDAPSFQLLASAAGPNELIAGTSYSSSLPEIPADVLDLFPQTSQQENDAARAAKKSDHRRYTSLDDEPDLDANGNPVPLERHQPHRILGFMPNYRSVSVGSKVHPPGWGYNFKVATKQSFDYSSFIFLGITSLAAEGINSHPVLGKGVGGFYAYTWRGFLDKTDGTYLGAWFLPSLLHEDTRYYPLGPGHSIPLRALYVISRQGVARTYGGHNTPNVAGLGAKVLTQVISRNYYPTGATDFSTLATKFAYAAMRDIGFSSIREFYPDAAAHYVRKHREKVARQSALDVQQSQAAASAASQHP